VSRAKRSLRNLRSRNEPQPAAIDGGKARAEAGRKNFASRKELMISACASSDRGAGSVLVALERYYSRQTQDYLRAPGTVYQTWLDHGPLVELEEVRGAIRDPATWDRLVEKFAARRRAGKEARPS